MKVRHPELSIVLLSSKTNLGRQRLMRMLDNIVRFAERSMTLKFEMIEDRKVEIELIL